jgi:hypothetical protein
MNATTAQKLNAGHNCWIPRAASAAPAPAPVAASRTISSDGFEAAPVASQQGLISGLNDFSNPLVRSLAMQSVENFFHGIVPATPTSAPMDPERFQNIDVTPTYLMGASYRAYNINGELMVEVTPVTQQGATPAWYDLGKVPSADIVNPMPGHNCWDPSTWGQKAN